VSVRWQGLARRSNAAASGFDAARELRRAFEDPPLGEAFAVRQGHAYKRQGHDRGEQCGAPAISAAEQRSQGIPQVEAR
jgi:hypothetical protein